MAQAARANILDNHKARAFWLKHLHQWHWMSAALCLIGMMLFSITGFTLNHAALFDAKPEVTTTRVGLPTPLLNELKTAASARDSSNTALPPAIESWLNKHLQITTRRSTPEWSEDELYVSLPQPGGDGWLSIDVVNGEVLYEHTDRGWLSYFNDLHKGRNTGGAWSLFIDVFAFAAVVFASTGLLLLKMHAAQRRATWPMVGFGLVLPLLLALLFIH